MPGNFICGFPAATGSSHSRGARYSHVELLLAFSIGPRVHLGASRLRRLRANYLEVRPGPARPRFDISCLIFLGPLGHWPMDAASCSSRPRIAKHLE